MQVPQRACRNSVNTKSSLAYTRRRGSHNQITHGTGEAFPTPLPTECLDGLHAMADALLAFLAFGHTQPDMARLAVWMAFVNGEPDVVLCAHGEFTITSERARRRARRRGGKEWVSALGAEEVLLVVRALAKLGVVKRDEAFVDDGGLAVVTSWGKFLRQFFSLIKLRQAWRTGPYLVIVKMAIRSTIVRIRAEVLQQLIAHTTSEASRVPTHVHRTNDASDDSASTPSAHQSTAFRGFQTRIG